MNKFTNAMNEYGDMTLTENGGLAYKTTSSDLLDMFANIGGMRDRDMHDVTSLWLRARAEDKELADNLVLYARNIRDGGLGERKIGRTLLAELAKVDPAKVRRNLQTIVDTGRWDDLFVLEASDVWSDVVEFIKTQIKSDIKGMKNREPVSICAKWLPSINTSSKETKRLANKLCASLNLTPRTYRKTLSALRKYLDVVERKMSAGQWESINFESVPSLAMSRYINCYNKRCQERFAEYKASLVKGEAKVNAATLYPYDIVKKYLDTNYSWYGRRDRTLDPVDEAQWKALPNYINEDMNLMFVCDVSGSMSCPENRPMATAVGLGIYFAQRNKGDYHNLFMTFSSNPTIQKIKDTWNLQQCIDHVLSSDWGMSTDLDKTFRLIYDVAVKAGEAPKAICIVSDMEINDWGSTNTANSITRKWQRKFAEAGLVCPRLIYWNVASRHGNVLAQATDNVAFVSGYGIGAFQFFNTLLTKDAYQAMVEILTKPQFQWK